MSSELYLIAHKVRGAPAFDIAHRMECPECITMGCPECDDLGYWWIVPTSGHRAYPWWSATLYDIDDTYELAFIETALNGPGLMPPACPDHYPHAAAPAFNLTTALGLDKPRTSLPPIHRRL